jgi:hypothetical protein
MTIGMGGEGRAALNVILLRKSKVKISLGLFKHDAMKRYWGSGGIIPRILNLHTRWR